MDKRRANDWHSRLSAWAKTGPPRSKTHTPQDQCHYAANPGWRQSDAMRFRRLDVNMASTYECSRNEVISNVGVLFAAGHRGWLGHRLAFPAFGLPRAPLRPITAIGDVDSIGRSEKDRALAAPRAWISDR